MTVYEMRTYTLHVGKMGEAINSTPSSVFPRSRRAARTRSSSATSRPTPA